MIMAEPIGWPSVTCPRCKATITWPTVLSAEEKRVLADALRSNPLGTVPGTRSELGLDLSQAKALSFHITRERRKCHRCRTAVDGEVSVCSIADRQTWIGDGKSGATRTALSQFPRLTKNGSTMAHAYGPTEFRRRMSRKRVA
jgi:hypothetical protein